MHHAAGRRALRITGIIMVVLLPVIFSVWFAQLRAVSDTRDHLRSFAQLILNRTSMVVQDALLARSMAASFRGDICSDAHRQFMLDIVRGHLFVEDIIYARGDNFLCSTQFTLPHPWTIRHANFTRPPDTAIYYYRDTPFYAGYKMIYMREGNYAVVINPRAYGDVMSDDASIIYGTYDTINDEFFSLSPHGDMKTLSPLIRRKEQTFQLDGRFYTIARSPNRPVAIIVSTTMTRFHDQFWHELTLTLPLGLICSVIVIVVWTRTRQQLNSPRRRLTRALNKQQLCLYYQPIIDIRHGRCVGAEALLRWPAFNGMTMSPAEFVPLAEKEGMIAHLTDYVVDRLFNDLGHYLAGQRELYISLNLSATDFNSPRLIAMIADKLVRYRVLPHQIKIEVTERGFIDVPKTTPVIQAFRQAGYEIAIEDFGTGYSNLHNLHSLNVDILKIDKSFIDPLATHGASHLVAEHIIGMAQSLRLKVIAEGVETLEQVNWLLKRGVQFCQGWYFAKALPPQAFIAWVDKPEAAAIPQPE